MDCSIVNSDLLHPITLLLVSNINIEVIVFEALQLKRFQTSVPFTILDRRDGPPQRQTYRRGRE